MLDTILVALFALIAMMLVVYGYKVMFKKSVVI